MTPTQSILARIAADPTIDEGFKRGCALLLQSAPNPPGRIVDGEIAAVLGDVEHAVLVLELLGRRDARARRKAKILRDALDRARAEG